MTRTLFLVRHGETLWNRERRFQGRTDIPLSDVGREQARALRRRLEENEGVARLFDLEHTAILSSDLARARETAELAFAMAGRTILVDVRLGEYGFGVF